VLLGFELCKYPSSNLFNATVSDLDGAVTLELQASEFAASQEAPSCALYGAVKAKVSGCHAQVYGDARQQLELVFIQTASHENLDCGLLLASALDGCRY
jgi:hypothetical protein